MTDLTQLYDFDALYEQRQREENQDAHLEVAVGASLLVVVCDGMGGVQGGSTASRLAVEAIRDTVKALSAGEHDEGEVLGRAIASANAAVYEAAQADPLRYDGMGTTAVVAWFKGTRVFVAWVGDSRMGLSDGTGFRWLTTDHTRVQALVESGQISQEEADEHPDGHILSRAVGVDAQVEIDILEPVDLVEGDTLLLCSDGVHGPIRDPELAELLQGGIANGLARMREMLLIRNSDDNATAVVVRLGPQPTHPIDAPPEPVPEAPPVEPPEPAVSPAPEPTQSPPPPPPKGRKAPEEPSNLGMVLGALALLGLVTAGAAWWFLSEGGGLPHASGLPDLDPSDVRVSQVRGKLVDHDCGGALIVLGEDAEQLARLAPEVQDCYASDSEREPWLRFVETAPDSIHMALEPKAAQSAQLVLAWGEDRLVEAETLEDREAARAALDRWTERLWEHTWWREVAKESDAIAYNAQRDRYHVLGKDLAVTPKPPTPHKLEAPPKAPDDDPVDDEPPEEPPQEPEEPQRDQDLKQKGPEE